MFDNFPFGPTGPRPRPATSTRCSSSCSSCRRLMTCSSSPWSSTSPCATADVAAFVPSRSKARTRARNDLVADSVLRFHGDLRLGRRRFTSRSARPRAIATEVYAVAKQWMWKFEHLEGQREINELHVPVGRDVKLIMTSQDVIHSFYVPAFRIKQDVLPGRYTTHGSTPPSPAPITCSAPNIAARSTPA